MAASDEKPGSHPGIERLLAVAMSGDCRGRAAVQLVDEALKCPGLYLYHELLHCPSLQNVSVSLPASTVPVVIEGDTNAATRWRERTLL